MSNNKFILPKEYVLYNVYPNPFNPVTNIIYGLSEYTNVQIVIFDLSGKQVKSLVNEFQAVGYHSTGWNAEYYPSGVTESFIVTATDPWGATDATTFSVSVFFLKH